MKINKDKHIGQVLFIVEGSSTEFNILRTILLNIFKFKYIEKRRCRTNWYVSSNDSHSKVAIINTSESNIKDIDDKDFINNMFEILINEYQFPVNKSAIYYIFDRDPKSNTDSEAIRNYINILKNPYENDDGLEGGQLLLHYPSVESFVISNFIDDSHLLHINLGADAKTYIGKHKKIQFNKLTEDTLLHATDEFIKFMKCEEIEWENYDEFSRSNLKIFEMQEKEYKSGNGYKVISTLVMAFL